MSDNQKDFEQLRKFSYAIAMSMVKNHDDAEDIAQNALIQFISSEDIQNAEAWTKKVTQNLVLDKFRDNKKSRNISHNLKTAVPEPKAEAKNELSEIDYKQISRLLSKEDRELYKKYSRCGFSIKAFAEKYELKYNTASSQIKSLKKNIKAMYLYEKGFNNTSTLNKQEWDTLYALIRRKFLNKKEMPFPIDKLLTFCFMRKPEYQNLLVIGKNEDKVVFFVVKMKFIKNRVKILEIKAPALVKVIDHKEKAQIIAKDQEQNPLPI